MIKVKISSLLRRKKMNENEIEEVCPVTAFQTVDVCLPVSVKPQATVGRIVTKCCGEAIIKEGTEICEGTPHGECNFTITQKICIEVPVEFVADVDVGEAGVLCHASSKDGCYDCEED